MSNFFAERKRCSVYRVAPLYVGSLGHAYGLVGHRSEAELTLQELIDKEAEGLAEPFHVAVVHIGLGNNEKALDWLEEAFRERNSHMLYLKQGAQFDSLRENPRFVRLIEKMGW